MNELPDLTRLSVAEKDQRIRELWSLLGLVRDLNAQAGSTGGRGSFDAPAHDACTTHGGVALAGID